MALAWLHIGNIAGNGFEAATLQRKLGSRSDVINPSLTHLISHPIWNDVEVSDFIDINDLEGLKRKYPDWQEPEYYYGGDLESALRKLADKNQIELSYKVETSEKILRVWQRFGKYVYRNRIRVFVKSPLEKPLSTSDSFSPQLTTEKGFLSRTIFQNLKKYGYLFLYSLYATPINFFAFFSKGKLEKEFPSLPHEYLYLVPALRCLAQIFPKYEGVVLYGPWVALGAWCSGLNFVAVEHGTLRNYIFQDEDWAKACRQGFKNARKVIVTNADCYPIAISEDYKETIAGIHPFDDERCQKFADLRSRFLNSDQNIPRNVILASRFQFTGGIDAKGSDMALKSIRRLHLNYPDLEFTIFAYGSDFNSAKEILLRSGLKNAVTISPVLSQPVLLDKFAKALCVLDGFSLAGSGRIQLESWRIGVPVLSKQDDELNAIFFKDKTPTFHADSESQIFDTVSKLYKMDNSKLLSLQIDSIAWYLANHSSQRFLSYLK